MAEEGGRKAARSPARAPFNPGAG